VKYFEFEAEVCLPLTSVTRLITTGPTAVASPEDIQLSTKGIYQCKYATDQQYYDAMVTAVTAHGCSVTYTLYGNAEEVPLAYLRKIHATATATHGKKPGQDKSLMPLNIPENLKILPTDTEEVGVLCLCLAYSFLATTSAHLVSASRSASLSVPAFLLFFNSLYSPIPIPIPVPISVLFFPSRKKPRRRRS
jgi:hypothetical protein